MTGLRIDHIDGLYDPKSYLQQWQTWALEELGLPFDDQNRSIFIVVEKILGKSEFLSDEWPCHGTTGYDFLTLISTIYLWTFNTKKNSPISIIDSRKQQDRMKTSSITQKN